MGGSCLCLNQPVAFTSCMKWQAPKKSLENSLGVW